MKSLLTLARWIDALNDRFAGLATWAVLAACLISAANAAVRYGLDYSSNAYLEIQWYLFAACVMLGCAQVLRLNEHVRVDVLYGQYPSRAKVLVDLMGLTLFLMPMALLALQGLSEIIKRVGWLTHRHEMDTHYERPLQ